jgi:TolB-like protein
LDNEFDVEPTADTQSLAVALKLDQPTARFSSATARLDIAPKPVSQLAGAEHFCVSSKASVAERLGLQLQPTPQLPSVAVLPFRSEHLEPVNSYFSDGFVEDIIISLAGLRELFVIARGSTLGFRFYEYDPRAIGKLLGVRYLISGSVRRKNAGIRISVELSETDSGRALWGATLSADLQETFDLQDQLVKDCPAHPPGGT